MTGFPNMDFGLFWKSRLSIRVGIGNWKVWVVLNSIYVKEPGASR